MAADLTPPGAPTSDPLLEVRQLVTEFRTRRGRVRAVNGVSLAVRRSEILGIVGESGSGKSVLGLSIMGLIEAHGRIASGQIRFDRLRLLPDEGLRRLRGNRIAMILQDPDTTLNPTLRLGEQVAEATRSHLQNPWNEARRRAVAMLRRVGLPEADEGFMAYPHEFSGDVQQKVVIACALILAPDLLIADEPTTALDVTVQAQILARLRELRTGDAGASILLISHDFGVIAQLCERVCVMYAGQIIEVGPTAEILDNSKHPNSRGLIRSIPRLDTGSADLSSIRGAVPYLATPPGGCRFHPRCPHATDLCSPEQPTQPGFTGYQAACHLVEAVA